MSNFNLKTNRLNYGDLLTPFPGYTLNAAIATTYSLDLQTLVASTISLGLGEATDSELRKNPLNLLAALLKVTNKTLIFCDSTQIKFPAKKTKLLMTLEKSVVPVSIPAIKGTNNYPSFHPKCWILQFENFETKERKYRFITLSRNLTFDRSWDVSVVLEGNESDENTAKTEPICNFIKFLKNQINRINPENESKNSILDSMLNDLRKVTFVTAEHEDFVDFEILPLGIGTYNINKDELFTQQKLDNFAIMSPFISSTVINTLINKKNIAKRPSLITRRSEVDKISTLSHNFDVYCLQDNIIDGEESVSEDDTDSDKDDILKQDIHAKVYITESDIGSNLYLGSMNASYNGINRNIELLVKLSTIGYTPEDFLKDIGIDSEKSAFELVNLQKSPAISNDKIDYEKYFKRLMRMNASAKIYEVGKNLYNINVIFEDFCEQDREMNITPLFAEGLEHPLKKTITFKDLHLDQLSLFYKISIDNEKRLLMIPTIGIPENRDKKIVTEIISNKKKLAEYIAFVLGDSSGSLEGDEEIETEPNNDGNNTSFLSSDNYLTPIYERMLKAAYSNPEKIKDIEYIIRLIDDDKIVTSEFKNLYNTFKSVLGIQHA